MDLPVAGDRAGRRRGHGGRRGPCDPGLRRDRRAHAAARRRPADAGSLRSIPKRCTRSRMRRSGQASRSRPAPRWTAPRRGSCPTPMPRRYEWVCRLGVLAYRDEKIDLALGHFRCTLSIVEARNDRAAITQPLKNVGSALRRDGGHCDALCTLERRLGIARTDRSDEVGGMLANIADVCRDLDAVVQAEAYTPGDGRVPSLRQPARRLRDLAGPGGAGGLPPERRRRQHRGPHRHVPQRRARRPLHEGTGQAGEGCAGTLGTLRQTRQPACRSPSSTSFADTLSAKPAGTS